MGEYVFEGTVKSISVGVTEVYRVKFLAEITVCDSGKKYIVARKNNGNGIVTELIEENEDFSINDNRIANLIIAHTNERFRITVDKNGYIITKAELIYG